MKKNTKLLLTLSLLGTTLFACNSIPLVNQRAEVRQEEATNSFAITNESSSVATLVGLPTSGVAGEEYSFVVSLKPGYQFNDKLTIKCGEENVTYTVKDGKFTFTMPEGAVNIKLDTAATEFTIYSTSMFVDHVLLDSEDEEDQLVANVRSTLPGTKLKFELKSSINFYCTKVMVNGVEIQENEEDGYYHFTMPTRPVIISTDKIARDYDINVDQTALKISTMKMYTDSETKEEVTKAHKGQKVYFEFAYDVTKVDYKFTAEYEANGKDDDETDFKKGTLNITKVEGNDKLYSFDMVSSKAKVVITSEKDCSKFVDHQLANKTWMMVSVKNGYNSSKNEVKTYSYEALKENKDKGYITLNDNGEGVVNTSSDINFEWDFEDKDGSTANYFWNPYGTLTYNQTIYFTDHLALIRDEYSSDWNDAFFGMKNNEYEMHVLKFNTDYRFVWIQDENANILESIFVCKNEVYLNAKVKTAAGEICLGSSLTLDAEDIKFYSATDKELLRYNNGNVFLISDIVLNINENINANFTIDGTDTPITFAEEKQIIKMKLSLKENAPEGTEIVSVKANYTYTSYGKVYTSDLTLNAVEGEENAYTFTMPTSKASIIAFASVPNKESGFSQLGTYKAFGPNSYSTTETSKTSSYEFTLPGDGTLRKKYGSTETIYEIVDIENSTSGVITYTDGANTQKLYYSNGIIVTPQSMTSTDLRSIYIGIGWNKDAAYENVEARMHKKIDGYYNDNWVVSYYLNGMCFGSIFCYNNKLYTGVSIKFDGKSTSVGPDQSYHVYRGDTLLFDVINDEITSHVE